MNGEQNLLIWEVEKAERFTPSLVQQRLALAMLCAFNVQAQSRHRDIHHYYGSDLERVDDRSIFSRNTSQHSRSHVN